MKLKRIVYDSLLIACYVVISIVFGVFSFGIIQIRLSEVMVLLCLFDRRYILPMTLACFLSNLIGLFLGFNVFAIDVLIGTLASLISCVLVFVFRRLLVFNRPLVSMLMPVIVNGLMIGYELAFLSGNMSLFFTYVCYISLGEFVSVFVLGLLLWNFLIRIHNGLGL